MYGLEDAENTLKAAEVFAEIIERLKGAFSTAMHFAPEDKRGGAFSIVNHAPGIPIQAVMILGDVSPEKREKYLQLAPEKSTRLKSRPLDVSSWQSRNPEAGEWGGAIRGRHFIFSFSGFPELLDEAMMLLLGAITGDLTWDEAQHIASLSGNEYYGQLTIRYSQR